MKIFVWKDYRVREYQVNSFNVDSGYSFPLHSHDNHWEFVYCEEGEFEHKINGRSLKHGEGEIFFIRESDTHALKGKNFKYHNIAFSGAWLESLKLFLGNDLLEHTVLRQSTSPRITVPLKERETMSRRIRSLISKSRGESQILEFSHFLFYLFDLFLVGKEDDEFFMDVPPWFQRIVRYINSREEGIPSLDQVIEKSCKCPEHVSRSFRKYLSMTPSAYLKSIRLKKAAELLKNTNYSVKEVCYLSSYENSNYFHKQFRESFSQTPSEYRKSHSRIIH